MERQVADFHSNVWLLFTHTTIISHSYDYAFVNNTNTCEYFNNLKYYNFGSKDSRILKLPCNSTFNIRKLVYKNQISPIACLPP